jgi:hypothetical protein
MLILYVARYIHVYVCIYIYIYIGGRNLCLNFHLGNPVVFLYSITQFSLTSAQLVVAFIRGRLTRLHVSTTT